MEFSIEAKAILFGAFLNPRSTLTFQNQKSVASPRARKGLDELQAAGILVRTTDGAAETFRMTEAGKSLDRREIEKDPFSFMQEYGRFPLNTDKTT